MLSDKRYLVLHLKGPLQSWGFDSQYNRRNTGLMPTRSAIAGMCCAALGLNRGSEEERIFLKSFNTHKMTIVAIPIKNNTQQVLSVRRLQDYHTVGGGYNPNSSTERGSITVKAKDGSPRTKNGQSIAVLTQRQYLTDSAFGVILQGKGDLLAEIAAALADPKWGIWLGRKTCIPSAPVLAGLKDTFDEALSLLVGDKPLECFTRQMEADTFSAGRDSLPDVPISFASDKRVFAPRRVITRQAGGK